MDIEINFNLNKIIQSKFGRFALSYYHYQQHPESKIIPKNNFERVVVFVCNLLGNISLKILDGITFLYFKSLTPKQIKRLKKTVGY